KNQKVLQNKHNELSTYGIGKDRTAEQWKMLGRSLLHQGLLDQTTDGYAVLKLNPLSWEVMRRQRSVHLVVTEPKKKASEETNLKKAGVEILFDKLRKLRKKIADEQSVPPYVVFADSTLKLMAQMQPQTLAEFSQLSGVGTYKLNQYGERFITEIKAYRQEQDLGTPPSKTKKSNPDTRLTTWELFEQGLSVEEIASQRQLKPTTIQGHLAELIEKGKPIDLNPLVSPEHQALILQAVRETGVSEGIKPIYEYLDGKIDYGEIRLFLAWWRQQQQEGSEQMVNSNKR
ncbi:MAG: DNA helicase RecQ, partial [Desertifilum sp. SIO1I2]|nr:DNA helicase RecQ [Desertifilum sp. SIO1I2]